MQPFETHRPSPLRECCMNTTANANLFSRLFDGLDDPSRLAIETRRRAAHQLWRSHRPRRTDGECAGVPRRQARRPRCSANRKIGAGAGALSRRGSRRRGLSAAQHRLYAERTGILHRRRRAVAGGVRPLEGGRHRRDRGEGRRQGRDAGRRRQGIADGRRRHGEARSLQPSPAPTTISPPSSTPRAPRAAPRARC